MKLINLKILNFKKFLKEFVFTPNGENSTIFGQNAAGKTSVSDAYSWLLIGKDTRGKTDFDVFHKDASPEDISYVSATFVTDGGVEINLAKEYKRKLERKNGYSTKEYTGNTSKYYINSIPKPLKEYNSFIEENFGNEEKIRMLTDPNYFANELHYTKRREILLNTFAPHLDEKSIIKAHPELSELDKYIMATTFVEDFAKKTAIERNNIKKKLDEISVRIDEVDRSRPEPAPEGTTAKISELALNRMRCVSQLSSLETGESISTSKAEIAMLEADLSRAEIAYSNMYLKDSQKRKDNLIIARRNHMESTAKTEQLKIDLRKLEANLNVKIEEIDNIRKQYHEKRNTAFLFTESNTHCDKCGQELPIDELTKIEAEFNFKKSNQLSILKTTGHALKNETEKIDSLIIKLKEEIINAENISNSLEEHVNELSQLVIEAPPFNSTDEYKELMDKIVIYRAEFDTLTSNSNQQKTDLQEKIKAADIEIDILNHLENNKEQIRLINERIKQLMEDEKNLGIKLAEKDNLLELVKTFTMLQSNDIESKVNSAFTHVKWKLFNTQMNGGIAPCCDAMVNGLSCISNVNHAATINAGLDIIDTITRTAKLEPLPIFFDGAESVTEYIPVTAQFIKLQVSTAYNELEIKTNN